MKDGESPPAAGKECLTRQWIEIASNERPFVPHPFISGGHLQTLAASRWRRRFPSPGSIDFLHLEFPDGSVIRCEWRPVGRNRPVLVILHGMSGSALSDYVQALAFKAAQKGWSTLLPSLYDRRSDGSRPRIFHAGCSDAAAELVYHAVRLSQGAPVFLIGVSMGGNIALKYLGEAAGEAQHHVAAAVMISPLVDLSASSRRLNRRSNRLYRWYFVRRLTAAVLSGADRSKSWVDVEALRHIRTIQEFDELVTAPLSGFPSAATYYREASSVDVLHRIRVPTLIIHADDDPLLPYDPLLRQDVAKNPFLAVWITNGGGHVGFIEKERRDIDRAWAENRALEFLTAVS
ncbi:MAG TPA: alpha/beta fold hydrolase [Acidobacteriota bacterium]|nr:alpha/beta fold hydrolase [Acidobacteriota bacterium]HRV07220.1 alpha/beta fold hydrolase [Acidobacteriota bacterium]